MTIYDEIGGATGVGAAVDGFYQRVTQDATLARHFAEVDLGRLKGHQRAFLAAAIGGPDAYLGRAMREAHAHLAITGEDFDLIVTHLVAALADLGVPRDTIDTIGAALAPLKDEVVATPP
jgi:hemoglobin